MGHNTTMYKGGRSIMRRCDRSECRRQASKQFTHEDRAFCSEFCRVDFIKNEEKEDDETQEIPMETASD